MSSEPIGLVVSVNVGQPREVRWHGRTVTTAIWKQPVSERIPQGLIDVLASDVVAVGDGGGLAPAALRPIQGAERVARLLIGGLRSPDFQAEAVWLNGSVATRIDVDGQVVAAMSFCVENGRITRIYGITNPRKLAGLVLREHRHRPDRLRTPFAPQGEPMNLALWIVAGLLASVMLVSSAKLFVPKEKIAGMAAAARWVEDFSPNTLKAIGALELLAAAGLILPAALDIAPVLVPLAAVGVALLMVGAVVTRLRRHEVYFLGDVAYLAMAAFVAWGRFGPESLIG